jgi:hypothetical protein
VFRGNDSREPDVHYELEVTGEAEGASVESEIPQDLPEPNPAYRPDERKLDTEQITELTRPL